jgi:exodeoxyribonuclease VII small subunit
VAKDPSKPAGSEQYSEVVARLQALVEALEGGGLSLEDSLEKFAEGIQLVRRGEKLLSEAEKRIEQLLSDDKTAPLELPENAAPPPQQQQQDKKPASAPQQQRPPPRTSREDDDVPF